MDLSTYNKCIDYYKKKEALSSREFISKLNEALSLLPYFNRGVLEERFEKLINEREVEIMSEIGKL